MTRTEMICSVCGCYSSAVTCWHCSTNPAVQALQAKIDILKQGLEDISNPMNKIEREKPEDCKLDGWTINEILKHPSLYKGIANETLRKFKEMGVADDAT